MAVHPTGATTDKRSLPPWLAYGLAGVVLLVCAPWIPHCFEKRQDLDRRLQAYERSNAGYDDVGRRLSLRFQRSGRSEATGKRRWELQRQRGTWDGLLGICVLGSLIASFVLLKPAALWLHRSALTWLAEDEPPRR